MAKKVSTPREENRFVEFTEWIISKLSGEKSSATKTDFMKSVGRGGVGGNAADWSRASHAARTILKRLHYEVDFEGPGNATLKLNGAFMPTHYNTRHFKPNDDYSEKQRIGRLVAGYLRTRENRHVLLGTGSTVYHVGMQMRQLVGLLDRGDRIPEDFGIVPTDEDKRFPEYAQLIWTVNIPLAADWCEGDTKPVDEVHIPGGVLRTKTFRYASMQPPEWSAAIAVVGADGCYYNSKSDQALLYGNSADVADNTNLFLSKATDTVICCLASRKLEYDENQGQNSGPPIEVPTDPSIRKFLVTDRPISSADNSDGKNKVKNSSKDMAIRALQKGGWNLVTKPEDWDGGNQQAAKKKSS